MNQEQQEREEELLRASFMGDIREDVEFLGLSLRDIGWIVGTTLMIGGFPFLLPFPVLFKMTWIVAIFMSSTLGQWLKWPYRLKRYIHDAQQKKEGAGEDLGSFLGVEEDGWLYRSGKTLHVVSSLSASPWKTAVYAQKRTRIGGFEQFLRAMVQEGFSAQISAEQIPDVRLELWNQKRNHPAKSPGIQAMKLNRIEMWERLAREGKALRSEYTLTLTTSESKIKIRERADEPSDLNPEALKRFRLLSELQEKKDRVLHTLTSHGGHSTSLLSGFSLPEIVGRWWDRTTWEAWKMNGDSWAEPSPYEVSEDSDPLNEQEGLELQGEERDERRSLFSPSLVKFIQDGPPVEDHAENEVMQDIQKEKIPTPLLIEDVVRESSWRSALQLGKWPIARWMQSGKHGISFLRTTWSTRFLPWFGRWIQNCRVDWQKVRVRKVKLPAAKLEYTPDKLTEEGILPPKLPTYGANQLQGIILLTSPIPSGKSFLAANLGVAASLSGTTVSIVDLSLDQGTRTVLNPLQQPSELDAWDSWSGKAADWMLFTPTRYPTLQEVEQLLQHRAEEDGLVIAEIPWNYPERETLLQRYRSIAVLDCDYHHWLRFVEAAPRWEGECWLNQSTPDMAPRMDTLLKEQYQQAYTAVYPYFPSAAYSLYQGRPLALDPDKRSLLNVHINREETTHEPAQTYEAVS
ncbi:MULTISPECIES: hypothetical protein [unclassified Paenibacillus]|uniref:hypothetical protein n=1 Tax=unclassified Paenibacillus TaxID=185978 RepID=UPI002405CF30|nr:MULTISPECIES: hypothetical protein [unclassified Paenibacillus]MDF9841920.1 hypothetical protein [Paenibacillus sp. PastF-2]MDF9848399.1 hypothetical protein [Paenibacillus sp. PastM-2]MDF9855080.1 hypothetical protein [Paenibacillus sp. PastF-1]MDH6480349.1 hypothetical protein [Paenibacillus sp. PastH-2]MDH6507667.1 hypothetical protein [Paenibacillus sp. PastM-3]